MSFPRAAPPGNSGRRCRSTSRLRNGTFGHEGQVRYKPIGAGESGRRCTLDKRGPGSPGQVPCSGRGRSRGRAPLLHPGPRRERGPGRIERQEPDAAQRVDREEARRRRGAAPAGPAAAGGLPVRERCGCAGARERGLDGHERLPTRVPGLPRGQRAVVVRVARRLHGRRGLHRSGLQEGWRRRRQRAVQEELALVRRAGRPALHAEREPGLRRRAGIRVLPVGHGGLPRRLYRAGRELRRPSARGVRDGAVGAPPHRVRPRPREPLFARRPARIHDPRRRPAAPRVQRQRRRRELLADPCRGAGRVLVRRPPVRPQGPEVQPLLVGRYHRGRRLAEHRPPDSAF